MRALGAQKGFVQRIFIIETLALTVTSGVGGVLMGLAAVGLLYRVPVRFANQVLVLTFGGTSLRPAVSVGNLALSLAASVLIGLIAWIYPVRLALRIQPVRAIRAS